MTGRESLRDGKPKKGIQTWRVCGVSAAFPRAGAACCVRPKKSQRRRERGEEWERGLMGIKRRRRWTAEGVLRDERPEEGTEPLTFWRVRVACAKSGPRAAGGVS